MNPFSRRSCTPEHLNTRTPERPNTKRFSHWLCSAIVLTALLLVPTASRAQFNTNYGGNSLLHNTMGTYNSAFGYDTLVLNTTGGFNSAIGAFTLNQNSSGYYNTAIGYDALYFNTTANYNTATGNGCLFSNTTGIYNTANGFYALYFNTIGDSNVATGNQALYHNTTGTYNTATGYQTLNTNSTGSDNTANGANALYFNTIGNYNTANGNGALYSNTTSISNTANGANALYFNTIGQYNTANGVGALYSNKTGNNNTADGYFALFNATTGSYNIALGNGAGDSITTGSNNISIGNTGAAADNGVIRIGTVGKQEQTYIAGISGVTASGGVEVFINANGQLGTTTSSRRFKYDIQDMGAKSDKLMDLRPVTFRYKQATEDGTHPQQYGLIAEEVAKVYPDLVQYDKTGKPFTVYYHLLTPMMLNELQKAHQKIDSLEAKQQSQKAALQSHSSGMASMQHTLQMMGTAFFVFVLVALAGFAYLLSSGKQRTPSWQARPIKNAPSL